MVQGKFHEPVLAAEIIALIVRKPGIYVDGTLGGGGHSLAILRELFDKGYAEGSLLIGIDQDDAALREARERLADYAAYTAFVKGNFAGIAGMINQVCSQKGLQPKVAGILLDLGVSSFQIDTAERGFSYLREGPLDMRMDTGAARSAGDIVNTCDEKELARLIYRYGEEPRSRSIARAIVASRQKNGPLRTTEELANIIRGNALGRDKVIKDRKSTRLNSSH